MTAMETVSERELLTPRAVPQSRKWPWTSRVKKIRDWFDKQKAASYRRRFRNALGVTQVGIAVWRSVASISPEDRVRLEARFRHAWRAEYRRRSVNRRLGRLLQAGIVLSYLAYFAVLPMALPGEFRADSYFDTPILAFVGSGLIIILARFLVSWTSKYLDGRWTLAGAARDTGSIAGTLLISILALYCTSQASTDPFPVVLLGLVGSGIVFAAVLGVAGVALSVATNLARRRNPDALLAAALFGALRSLEIGAARWPDPEFRAGIARELGAASRIARFFLFRKFEPADPATRLWQWRQGNRIAEGLAQKQLWLITPKPDTYDFLLGALVRCLVAALGGTWDELVRPDAPETADAQAATSRPDVSRG